MSGAAGALAERRYSESTAREIDCAVRDCVQEAYQNALRILAHARPVLEEGARLLLEKETLTESELQPLRHSISSEPPQELMRIAQGA
jgi:cell division protease FtsH